MKRHLLMPPLLCGSITVSEQSIRDHCAREFVGNRVDIHSILKPMSPTAGPEGSDHAAR